MNGIYKPRTELATHEVANQPRPLGDLHLLRGPAFAEALVAAFEKRDARSIDLAAQCDLGGICQHHGARSAARPV